MSRDAVFQHDDVPVADRFIPLADIALLILDGRREVTEQNGEYTSSVFSHNAAFAPMSDHALQKCGVFVGKIWTSVKMVYRISGPTENPMRMSSLPGAESAAVFRFGELTFDCRSHLLLKNGVEQHLSPKAQQLLRMLLLNRPKAVSREEIYDALWPSTFVCETNMASIVSELRRALGDDARSAQYIRTVHGFGYAFSADVETPVSECSAVAMLCCEGQRHLLYDGENSVGRAPDCRVVLTEATVSRQHAAILIVDNAIWIEDRGSRNGTSVRGQRISRSRVPDEARIAFGAVQAWILWISRTTPPMNVAVPRRQSTGGMNSPPPQ